MFENPMDRYKYIYIYINIEYTGQFGMALVILHGTLYAWWVKTKYLMNLDSRDPLYPHHSRRSKTWDMVPRSRSMTMCPKGTARPKLQTLMT